MSAPPTRTTAADFEPEVLRLFDQYVHGLIDRRGFLERAARVVVGGSAGAAATLAASAASKPRLRVVRHPAAQPARPLVVRADSKLSRRQPPPPAAVVPAAAAWCRSARPCSGKEGPHSL